MAGGPLTAAAARLFASLEASGLRLVLAESCTGGLACEAFTAIPGSSALLWGGFIAYTVESKIRLLGIDPARIDAYGVVSRETALAMARGCLAASGLGDRGVAGAVTGFAGPGADPGEDAPGRVCCAWTGPGGRQASEEYRFPGGRSEVREAAAITLLEGLSALIESLGSGKDPVGRY